MNNRVGIVFVPSLFGTSKSTIHKIKYLRSLGNKADIVNIYGDHYLYSIYNQNKPKPPSVTNNNNNTSSRKNIANSIVVFKEKILFSQINDCVEKLKINGCDKIVCLADGFGAIVIYRYIEEIKNKDQFIKIFMWYPHVIFSNSYKKLQRPGSIKEPALDSLGGIPVTVFHGNDDHLVEPKNLSILQSWASKNPNVELVIYPGADHAFAQTFVQGWIPNFPYYWFHKANRKAHKDSWNRVYKELERIANED